jgi:glucose/arabinose dehydrogenase
MKLFYLFLFFSSFQLCCCQNQTRDDSVSNLKIINAFPGLSFTRPVDFQIANDGSNRIYVVEQQGLIYSFENERNVKEKSLFLDIRDRVNDSGNEEGLLGLAFHPDFTSNGHFFVDYTAAEPRRTVIARYSIDRQNPLSRTGEIFLQIPQPFSNHNGGQLAFGEDGYLYIALGDGGSAGDPDNNGQNLHTLLGSILRIDVNQPSSSKKYSIPPDNPFAGNTQGYCEEIFAYGLRNPWRFSIDPVTKLIWTGDVGQNKYEEIDIIVNGGNYGWNIREGFHPFREGLLPDRVKLIDPIFEYDHSVGQSITGGFVYRGSQLSSLQGKYIYADFVQGQIWALNYQDNASVSSQLLLDTNLNFSSFGIDLSGELYLCAFDGGIYTLVNESRP